MMRGFFSPFISKCIQTLLLLLLGALVACSARKPQLTNNAIQEATYFHTREEKTCLPCHEAQRPTQIVGNPPFDHSLGGRGDCFGCHAQSTTQYNSMSDWAGAIAAPSNLIGTKIISVDVETPVFDGTSITKVNESKQSLTLQMSHTSNQVPAAILSKCENCHSIGRNGNYTKGILHKSLDHLGADAPTACSSCHVNAAPTGFVGAQGAGRSPPSAEMRHEAVVWSTSADGKYSPTNNKIVTQDCAVCHGDAVGSSWSEGTYHIALKIAGQSQPKSCLDCHANNRPRGLAGNSKFDHTKSGGMGECFVCHKNAEKNNFRSWISTYEFNHEGVTNCSSCHESNRPTNTSGWTQAGWSMAMTTFDLSKHSMNTDCKSCHSGFENWQGGKFDHKAQINTCRNCHTIPISDKLPDLAGTGLSYKNHSSYQNQDCVGCHGQAPNYDKLSGWGGASQIPAGLVNGTGFEWNFWNVNGVELKYQLGSPLSSAQLIKTEAKLPQQILHTSSQLPTSLLGDCKSCHTNGMSENSGTRFHTNIAVAEIKSCKECHQTSGMPKIIVGDGAPTMNHQAISETDCVKCHKDALKPKNSKLASAKGEVDTSWKNGSFHENISSSGISSCVLCHITTVPKKTRTTDVVYSPVGGADSDALPQHFSHLSPTIKQDCIACHTSSGSDSDWESKVKFHDIISAKTITDCAGCHAEDVSNKTSYPIGATKDKYLHSPNFSKKDCLSCHATTTGTWVMNSSGTLKQAPPAYSNVGVTWASGFYDHIAPNGNAVGSCGSCHNSGGFYSHKRVNASSRYRPCNTCH